MKKTFTRFLSAFSGLFLPDLMPGSFAGLFLELKRFTVPILLLPFFSFCLADTYAQCRTVAYNVGGGGAYCAGGSGVAITLNGSETGVDYFLVDGSSADVTSLAGTGAAAIGFSRAVLDEPAPSIVWLGTALAIVGSIWSLFAWVHQRVAGRLVPVKVRKH